MATGADMGEKDLDPGWPRIFASWREKRPSSSSTGMQRQNRVRLGKNSWTSCAGTCQLTSTPAPRSAARRWAP